MRPVSRTFVRLFLSYAVILLLPVMLIAFMHTLTSRRMIDQNIAEYTKTLRHTAELISVHATDIRAQAEAILFDKEVRDFLRTPQFADAQFSSLYQWKDALTKYKHANANIHTIHILSGRSGWLLSNGNAVLLNETFYPPTLGFTGLDYDQWNRFAASRNFNGFHVFPNGTVAYVMTVTSDIKTKNLLILQINPALFQQFLSRPLHGEGAVQWIIDTDGQIITDTLAAAPEAPFEQADALRLAQTLAEGEAVSLPGYQAIMATNDWGWRLLSLVPRAALRENVDQLTGQLIQLAVAIFAVGLALCYFLTRNKSRALRRITSFLATQTARDVRDNHDAYVYIENAVAHLVEKNNRYEQLGDEQKRLIDHELGRRLLLGQYSDDEQLAALLARSQPFLDASAFAVMAFVAEDGRIAKADTQRVEAVLAGRAVMVYAFKTHIMALFLLRQPIAEDQWQAASQDDALRLREAAQGRFRVCVSAVHASADAIRAAYDEVVALMEFLRVDDAAVLHFHSFSPMIDEAYYYYPIDVELHLIHALKQGNSPAVSDVLMDIRTENLVKRKLSAFMLQQLVFELRGAVIRNVHQYVTNPRIDGMIRALLEENSFDGIMNRILDIAAEIDCALHDAQVDESQALQDRIYAFMMAHFSNANLTINDLIAPFGMSERMLYDFIRDHFNTSFSKLLESLRITKACELMRTGSTAVKDIAIQTGYNNDHTFRIAFKRMMNVTPSEYLAAHRSREGAGAQEV